MPGAVEWRRDPAHDGLRVRLVHRPGGRRHRVVGPDPEEAGARGAGWGKAGDGGGGRRGREEGAEQDELPAECRGGGPHAPPERLLLVSPRVRARAGGPAHQAFLPWESKAVDSRNRWRGGQWRVVSILELRWDEKFGYLAFRSFIIICNIDFVKIELLCHLIFISISVLFSFIISNYI